ncbi:MAG: hypothetical protein WC648_01350 [Candidatus Paceibacterota bacterium]|jgi:hypothetical protein
MKTATLEQIQKILSFLNDIPSEQVQKAMESGLFSDVIREGKLDTMFRRLKKEKLLAEWRMVCLLARPEEIVVTIPRDPDTYHGNDPHKTGKYQIRVWKRAHGHFKRHGHVSDGGLSNGGPLLLEYYYESPQIQTISHVYPQTGDGELCDDTTIFPKGYEWCNETKTVEGKGVFDVFTMRRKF